MQKQSFLNTDFQSCL